jgi:hypothetical protein
VTSFEEITAGLRAWAAGDRLNTAAVELLITHETWLRRRDFLDACIDPSEDMARIGWDDARRFEPDSLASTTERAVLRLAIAIGSDDYRLAAMGRANSEAIVQAFTTALTRR